MKNLIHAALVVILMLSVPFAHGETRVIKVGMFTTDPVKVKEEGKVMEYLSKKAGVKFIIQPIIGYEKSVQKLADGYIDAGIFGSAPAYISIQENIAEPIARPESRKSSVYYGYWISIKGNGLNSIPDFKGKRFAYVDPYTSAGYLFPKAAIKAKGFDPDSFFSILKYAGTHEAAIQMLLNGTVDGCAAKDTAYKKFIETNIALKEKLNIIEVAGPFPERTLTISKRIDAELRKKVKAILLNMDKDPEGIKILAETGRSRYVETSIDDFSAIKNILDILKVGNNK